MLLHHPDARIVVDTVAAVVTGVGRGKVKVALCRIVKAVFGGKLHDVFARHHPRAFRRVLPQTALVAGCHVLFRRAAVGKPLMRRAGFKVPDVLIIDKAHTKAFSGTDLFDDAPQKCAGFFRRRRARQNHVRNIVFADAGFFVPGINQKGVIAGKDGFGAGETDA